MVVMAITVASTAASTRKSYCNGNRRWVERRYYGGTKFRNVTSINGKTTAVALGTGSADILTCASEKLLKINSIIVSNIDGTNAPTCNVLFYNADNTTVPFHICKVTNVSAGDTLIVLANMLLFI